MKTLYLLRHAKSSWDDTGLSDHDRPLSARGRKAARAMASVLAKQRPGPKIVLCSSALRARQTWEPIAAALVRPPEVRLDERLYGADAARLLDLVSEIPEGISAALVVGHNPGLQDLALELSGDGRETDLARLRDKFPTGALATFTVGGRWVELGPGGAYLDGLVLPRGLTA